MNHRRKNILPSNSSSEAGARRATQRLQGNEETVLWETRENMEVGAQEKEMELLSQCGVVREGP